MEHKMYQKKVATNMKHEANMPLGKNVGKNIKELMKDNMKKGKAKGANGKARRRKQIIAIALNAAGKSKKSYGAMAQH